MIHLALNKSLQNRNKSADEICNSNSVGQISWGAPSTLLASEPRPSSVKI
jgi:hypothetical protein